VYSDATAILYHRHHCRSTTRNCSRRNLLITSTTTRRSWYYFHHHHNFHHIELWNNKFLFLLPLYFCHVITNHHSLCVVVFRLAQSPSPYDTGKCIDDDDDAHDDSNIIIQSDFCFQWTDYMVVDFGVQIGNGSLSQ
jgi:hypothetical protein